MRKIFLLFVLSFSSMLSIAQQTPQRIRFEHLTVANGLPVNAVFCILQDHLGFIWLGSLNGLVRYDGNIMTSYQNNPDSPYSLKGGTVGSLWEDRNGDIWIGSKSLFRFERATGRFIEYPDKYSSVNNSFPSIRFSRQDKQGNIWTIRIINGKSILNRFNPKTSTWDYFNNDRENPHHLTGNSIYYEYEHFGFAEDKNGIIWISTIGENENVLQRLDPKKDKFIRYEPNLSPAMAEDFRKIGGITAGKQGELYISSYYAFKGWYILNTQTGQIKQFRHNTADTASLLSDTVLITPYPDKSGFVWISTGKGMDRYDPVTNRFAHYISKPGDLSTPASGYLINPYETSEGDIWFHGNTGMSFYNRKTNRFTRYVPDEKKEDGLWGYISCTFVDRTGMVWLGSYSSGMNKESRINQFPLFNNIPGNPNSLQDATVNSIYETPSEPGIMWIGTNTGLDRYDKKTGGYTHYRHEEHNGNSISKGAVSSIAEDKKGRFWVATSGGLNLMDRKKGSFSHFVHDTSRANSLMYNGITFLKTVSDGTLWIGTYTGLNHFDYDNNTFTYYQKADSSYTHELFNLITQCTTPDRRVAAILHPADNVNMTVSFDLAQPADLLVTGMGEMTSINNEDWGWIEDASGKSMWNMNFANTLSDGFEDARIRAGIIRLNTGTYRLKYKSDAHFSYGHWNASVPYHSEFWGIQVTKISPQEAEIFNKEVVKRFKNGLGSNAVYCITEDSKKNIWIGCSDQGGITKFDPVTGKFVSYIDYFRGPLFVLGSILEDKETGNFWVGDNLFGLLLINSQGEILKRYNTSNGLPSNTIMGIQQDIKRILWISTDNGLCRFDPASEKFQWYNKKHGLQSLAFNRMAFCNTVDGELYFGGVNGINAFYPDQIKLDTQAPPVVFTDLDIAGITATLGKGGQMPVHISVAKNITLGYNQNDLTFYFTSLLFNRGTESQFAYKLSPGDKDWVQSGTIRQARYTYLSPGTYTFSVKAANADGVWNETGTAITFTILPPWWRTWWAYIFYGLCLLAGLFFTDRFRRKIVIERERAKTRDRELVQAKEIEKAYTELKSTQAQLIQSEKMASLGELTAGIAHEIQNPLNFMNNFSEVNKELLVEMKDEIDKGNTDEVKSIANYVIANEDKINHHGKRADAIVKGMLQHSRSSSSQREPTDINGVADECLRLSYHGLRAKDSSFNAILNTDFDANIGKMNIIPQDIGRVLLNLYNNAFYAVNEKSKEQIQGYEPAVSVSTKKIGDKIEIRVKDNGNGIPAKIIDKIFQPFFTTKPAGEGTGLGLSLSYDIIKAHGGEISVNTKEGGFTEFIIQMPI